MASAGGVGRIIQIFQVCVFSLGCDQHLEPAGFARTVPETMHMAFSTVQFWCSTCLFLLSKSCGIVSCPDCQPGPLGGFIIHAALKVPGVPGVGEVQRHGLVSNIASHCASWDAESEACCFC